MILTAGAVAEKGRAATIVLWRWPAKSVAAVAQIFPGFGKK